MNSADIAHALRVLPFARFTFRLRALSPLQLPPFKGGTLRGVLGHALREKFCPNSDGEWCFCEAGTFCAYRFLFGKAKSGVTGPRPFVLDVPPIAERRFTRDDGLDFGVTLVGDAISHIDSFIEAFEHAARMHSLGRRGPDLGWFGLDAVWQRRFRAAPQRVYGGPVMPESVEDILYPQSIPPDGGVVGVSFVTPTHLRYKAAQSEVQEDVDRPYFFPLIRRLLQRCEQLAASSCGARLELDYPALHRAAREVELIADETRWCRLQRFSTGQQDHIPVEGFIGDAYYAGDLAPFFPLLQLGEVLHVGKNTALGQGQYRIIDAWQRLDGRDLDAVYGPRSQRANQRRER